MVRVNCPICNSQDSRLMFRLGQKIAPYNISICEGCGFVFQNPRWSRERLCEYYQKDYDAIHRPRKNSAFSDKSAQISARQVYDRAKGFLPTPLKQLVDYGAGNGDIVSCFRENLPSGVECAVVEPSLACQQALHGAGFKILGASIADCKQSEYAKSDFITMRHVLEHFYDPVAELSQVVSLLRTGGRLYIAVPNLMHGNILDCLTFPHLSYFNDFTLRALVRGLPLDILELKTEGDEIYGVFERNDKKGPPIALNNHVNLADTLQHIERTYSFKNHLARRLRRSLSFAFPLGVLRKIAAYRNS